jgi:hypothetical protein
MIGRAVVSARTLSIIAVITGLWLVFSPYILGYTVAATAGQTVIGILVIAVAGFRFSLPVIRWPSWINVVLGVELIVMPFSVATHSSAIYWNTVLVGLVLIGMSAWSGSLHPLFTHHVEAGRLHRSM